MLADEDVTKSATDPARVEWLLGDGQQSVRDVVGSDATLLTHLVYDSYGNVVSQSDGTYARDMTKSCGW